MMIEPIVPFDPTVDLQTAVATLIKVAENLEIVRCIELSCSCRIVGMHACTDIGVMGVSEAAQGPRAMRWDAFRFSRLLVIRPESTPSRD